MERDSELEVILTSDGSCTTLDNIAGILQAIVGANRSLTITCYINETYLYVRLSTVLQRLHINSAFTRPCTNNSEMEERKIC